MDSGFSLSKTTFPLRMATRDVEEGSFLAQYFATETVPLRAISVHQPTWRERRKSRGKKVYPKGVLPLTPTTMAFTELSFASLTIVFLMELPFEIRPSRDTCLLVQLRERERDKGRRNL